MEVFSFYSLETKTFYPKQLEVLNKIQRNGYVGKRFMYLLNLEIMPLVCFLFPRLQRDVFDLGFLQFANYHGHFHRVGLIERVTFWGLWAHNPSLTNVRSQ